MFDGATDFFTLLRNDRTRVVIRFIAVILFFQQLNKLGGNQESFIANWILDVLSLLSIPAIFLSVLVAIKLFFTAVFGVFYRLLENKSIYEDTLVKPVEYLLAMVASASVMYFDVRLASGLAMIGFVLFLLIDFAIDIMEHRKKVYTRPK